MEDFDVKSRRFFCIKTSGSGYRRRHGGKLRCAAG
jgi:hypothetical protein